MRFPPQVTSWAAVNLRVAIVDVAEDIAEFSHLPSHIWVRPPSSPHAQADPTEWLLVPSSLHANCMPMPPTLTPNPHTRLTHPTKAVKHTCPTCKWISREGQPANGGDIIVSFKSGDHNYETELASTYKDKVYVHLLRSEGGEYQKGTDLYASLGVGESYDEVCSHLQRSRAHLPCSVAAAHAPRPTLPSSHLRSDDDWSHGAGLRDDR